MEDLVSMKSLPPGFRFHPTDEELFMYYLKRKVLGKSLNPHMISDLDVYQFAPWDLPKLATLKTRDLNWFFFCPRAKKYPNGGRANRATVFGYWKSTGNDRTMMYNSRPVGKIKTLIFHKGKAPKGERTDWVMHEYRLEDKVLADRGVPQDCYVICKIYEKSGLGPKNGEHYGARFVEEEWESDDDDGNGFERGVEAVQDMGHTPAPAPAPAPACVDSPDASLSVLTTFVDTPNVAPPLDASGTPTSAPAVIAANATCPISPAAAFVGNPYIAASVGMPNFTDASVGMPNFTDALMGMPNVTDASVGMPNFTHASMGMPNFTDASVGMPNFTDASMGMPNFTDASMGMPNFTDASMGSLSAFAPNSMGSLSAAAASTEEDEIDRLLAHFTTEHMEDANDIYRGLLDLPDPHPQTDIDWNNIIKLDDLM